MGKGPAALWGPPLVAAPLPRHSHIQVVLQGLGRDAGLVVLGGQVVGVLLQVAFQQAMLLQDLPQGLPPPQRDPGVQGRGEPIRHQEPGRDMPRGGAAGTPAVCLPCASSHSPWRGTRGPSSLRGASAMAMAGGAGGGAGCPSIPAACWELGSHPACLPHEHGDWGSSGPRWPCGHPNIPVLTWGQGTGPEPLSREAGAASWCLLSQ